MVVEVGQRISPVFTIRVSSNIFHKGPRVEVKNEVISSRTWLWADVRASLNFGQTQAKCVSDSGTPSWQCGQVGDLATPIRWRYVWTGYIPVMHLSHTRYSADLQRRMTLEIVAPSLWCRRSVTKVVLRFKTARKVLKAATASKRLRFGALSLGRVLLQFSANSRVVGRIRNQKDPYFCGPGQISGPSACLPSSANSSARSLRRQPVWLLTFTRPLA